MNRRLSPLWSILLLALALAFSAPAALAQSSQDASLEQQMTPEEYKASGLHKLSKDEQAALRGWIERQKAGAVQAAATAAPAAPAAVAATGAAGSAALNAAEIERSPLKLHGLVTLASIVEKETNKDSEKPAIAGVYLNRLRGGWRLQADPTLVFAAGDFEIRRVLDIHKTIESPYNTYLYPGLPPGPICIPSIASLEAVLNPDKHYYYYFCAKDDMSGYHVFASSYAEHELNAWRFRQALNRLNIRK